MVGSCLADMQASNKLFDQTKVVDKLYMTYS